MVNEEMEDTPEEGRRDTTEWPWWVTWAKDSQLGTKLKILLMFSGVIFGIYMMLQWFGWVFLLGVLPAPAWYFWAMRQIDRESYTVIEVSLKGDEYTEGVIGKDTQLNVWQIPPDIWKKAKQRGSPIMLPGRITVCDKYDPDNNILYYPEHSGLSNINFLAKVEMWLNTKRRMSKLTKELAWHRYNKDILVAEETTRMLERIGILEENDTSLDGYIDQGTVTPLRSRTVKEAEHVK
jgi:hypothetical protein